MCDVIQVGGRSNQPEVKRIGQRGCLLAKEAEADMV